MGRFELNNRLVWACVAVIGLSLGGCATSAPQPTAINAQVSATEDVNISRAGEPSPIFLRFYELKSDALFSAATFDQLYEGAPAVLGENLQGSQELFLAPDESKTVSREFKQGSRFLGVLAAYQDIENATWRAVIPVAEHETTDLVISVGRSEVTIGPAED
jgi:type VI secretion system protein VasD